MGNGNGKSSEDKKEGEGSRGVVMKAPVQKEPKKLLLDLGKRGSLAEEFLALCHDRYIGQPRLVEFGAEALDDLESFMKSGERDEDANGVIASVLVPGPSGAGKTYIARLIAKVLTGRERGFFFIPGQNYQERHAVETLLHPPPGYIGSDNEPVLTQEKLDEPGFLHLRKKAIEALSTEDKAEHDRLQAEYQEFALKTQSLRNEVAKTRDQTRKRELLQELGELQPKIFKVIKEVEGITPHVIYDPNRFIYPSVVLGDEFEKGHDSLFKLFLGVLGDGVIVTRKDETVDFHGSIVVLTSNLCKEEIAQFVAVQSGEVVPMGFHRSVQGVSEQDDTELYRLVRDTAIKVFGPEFMGRLDELILARMLMPKEIREILESKLRAYQEHLASRFPIKLEIADEVIRFFYERSTRKRIEGARLVDKTLKQYLLRPIMKLRLTGQIKRGDHVVVELERKGKKHGRPVFYLMDYGDEKPVITVEYKRRRNHKPQGK
ncbi:MAG: ATP-dependent Clp protease ATP-binding subunit [Parcubacteria group bacterium]|nr:ATP-dependent Clp protease ATP-binding subunit [Parcubacteria group bacterium]